VPSRLPAEFLANICRDTGRHQIIGHYDGQKVELPPGGLCWNAAPFFAAVYNGPAAFCGCVCPRRITR
jgi:hypothetical protein